MRHIDLDIRPMAWATRVKIDGVDMPCSRVSVVSDFETTGRQETRVELVYYPVDESGSYHQPAVHVEGCLLDAEEYGRFAEMRALLLRLRDTAELAALLPQIEDALGWEK